MKIILSIFLISITTIAFGQTESVLETATKKGRNPIVITPPITVIGTTPDASPNPNISSDIKLPDLPTSNYDVSSILKNTSVKDSSKVDQNLNSIRFSLGTYYNSNLETNIINAKQNFGLSLQHNANQVGATKDWNSKRYNNNIYLWTKLKPNEKLNFENSITFQNLGTYFYGNENDAVIYLTKGNEITYDKWFYDGSLSNEEDESPFKWEANIGANQLNGSQGLSEKNLTGSLDLKIPFSEGKYGITMNSQINKSIFSNSIANIDRSITNLQPTFFYKSSVYSIYGGINYVIESQFESKSHIFPKIEFNYQLSSQHQLAAGLTGDLQFNYFGSLIKENIYLTNKLSNFQNTKNPIQVYAIFKGGESKETSAYKYQVKLKYSTFNNLPIFINGKRDSERDPLFFNVEYIGNNSTVSNFQIDAILYGKFNPEWSNTIYLKSDNYAGDIGYSNIILRPAVDITNKINYNSNKWDFGMSIAYTGGLYGFQTKENRVVKMDDIVLINLSGSYQFSPSFRAYSNFNNLLNQKYQRIINYREIGFNFNAGILYEF